MKKYLALILIVSLMLPLFGCSKVQKTDVWDGSIAEVFADGDGSEKKPYAIKKASQLALIAKQVNEGNQYEDKYFSLLCDIDLNNLDWTPIGNGKYSFNGIFNGQNHTISNLKITNGATFAKEYTGGELDQYTTGLFGSCCNATIKNTTVNKASVTVQNVNDADYIMSGVLIGTLRTDSFSELSNINVADAGITCEFESENRTSHLRIGGIIGYVYGNDESSIKMNNINSDTSISIESGNASYNYVGGVVGTASIGNLLEVSDCASYLSLNLYADPYLHYNYFGAFGSMLTQNDVVKISDVFSKVTVDKIHESSHGFSNYNANAIIGETYHGKQKDGTIIGGYKFQNLFGYVEQVDALTKETARSMQLYELEDHVVYTETNCLGCASLPADHGFDASVWDLTDLSNPKVK